MLKGEPALALLATGLCAAAAGQAETLARQARASYCLPRG
jgi:hypothetical protein